MSEKRIHEIPIYKLVSSTPDTPSTGYWKIYPKTDGWYILDDTGTETIISTGGGSTPTLAQVLTAGRLSDSTGTIKTFSDSVAIDINNRRLYHSDGTTPAVNWGTQTLIDTTFTQSLNWENRTTVDSGGAIGIDYENRLLVASDGTTTVFDWKNQRINSSLGIGVDILGNYSLNTATKVNFGGHIVIPYADDSQITFSEGGAGWRLEDASDYKIGHRFNIHRFEDTGANELMRIVTSSNLPRVSIGTTSGGSTLHIKGGGATSATFSLKIQNSSDDELFFLNDAGVFTLGLNAVADGNSSFAIGAGASTGNFNGAIAIGANSSATTNDGISIGASSQANGAGLALGNSSVTAGFGSITIGHGSTATTTTSIVFGENASSTATRGVVLGYSALSSGYGGISIGFDSECAHNFSIALGRHSITTASKQFVIGSTIDESQINEMYIGRGVSSIAANLGSFTLNATGVTAGVADSSAVLSTLIFAGAKGTGTGLGGDILFQVATAGSTGSTQNSLAEAMRISQSKSVMVYGSINFENAQTVVNASTSGDVTYSQPFCGTSYKKIIIYLNSALGTASYTFPVAFTNIPAILTTDQLSSSVITSLSITDVTVTGVTSSGFIFLEGY